MKKVFGVTLITLLALVLVSVVFVSADGNDTNVSVGNNMAVRNSSTGINCNALNSRIDAKINAFDNGKLRRANSYNNVMNTLNRISQRLIAGGVSSSAVTIQADMASLNASVQKFDSDYALFIEDLESTKNFTCGHSQGEFVGALKVAKDQMKIVNADAKDVKSAVKKVKADIEALRDIKLQNKLNNQINRVGNQINRTQNRYNLTGEQLANLRQRQNNLRNRLNSTEENQSG